MIPLDMVLVGVVFYSLLALTLIVKDERKKLLEKTWQEWVVDISGLMMQGVVVPLAKSLIIIQGLIFLWPAAQSSVELNGFVAFLLAFVLVDYLYYWNHRCLHSDLLWPIHSLHHTPQHMDLTITSRNMLWTPILIVYIWAHSFFFYILKDPTPYLWGVALTAALDLWRHTNFCPDGLFHLAKIGGLITPRDHKWHHASGGNGTNFGANLNVWDRLHSTFQQDSDAPKSVGIPTNISLSDLFIYSGRLQAAYGCRNDAKEDSHLVPTNTLKLLEQPNNRGNHV